MSSSTHVAPLLAGQAVEAVAHSVSSVSWSRLKVQLGKGKNAKRILSGSNDEGLSGELQGGQFCAIMGPSGAGKTTMLNALAGRVQGEGEVLYGGRPLTPSELRGRVAFVIQEDILCGTQTPREALLFSAALRLPSHMPLQDKRAAVERILTELRLQECADRLIGDQFIRGISGGEKKRTSIGVELVMQPQVLFLDEPTSGLDSFAAFSVISNLLQLSESGCTILCTIHQPSSEIFHLFRKVLLLAPGGFQLYLGAAEALPKALNAGGYACPQNTNPADHAMFLLQTEPADKLMALATQIEQTASAATPPGVVVGTAVGPGLLAASRGAGFLTQIAYLAQRERRTLFRDRAGTIAMVLVPLLLNLFFALIFYQAGDRSKSTYSITTHFGSITQIAIGGMFGAAQPLLLKFPLEAALFKREYASRSYGATAYFLSKTVVELPKAFVVSALTWLASYYLMSLEGPIIYYILILWLTGLAASSTALLVGCLSSNVEVALQAAPVILVPQILFAGFFIQSNQIPVFLRWAQYLCSLRYGINMLLITEFAPPTTNSWSKDDREAAAALLKHEEIKADDWWLFLIILLGLVVAFRLIAIVALSRRATYGMA